MARGERIRRKEHSNIKFTDRTTPVKGIISLILAVVSLALLVFLLVQSVKMIDAGLLAESLEQTEAVTDAATGEVADSATSLRLGAGGFLALLLSLTGLILGIRCFSMHNIYRHLPIAGTIGNGVVLILFVALYVMGLVG